MVEYHVPSQLEMTADDWMLAKLKQNSRGVEMPAWCFHLPEHTRICAIRSNKAPRLVKTVLPLLTRLADREKDILILNFGAW